MSNITDKQGSNPKRIRPKKKKKTHRNDNEATKVEDLMIEGDEELIKDVDNEKEVVQFNEDTGGQEIETSEIADFMDKLGIRNYVPDFNAPIELDNNEVDDQSSTQQNGTDIEIKEEPAEGDKKKKKKKNKDGKTDQIKKEPEGTNGSTVTIKQATKKSTEKSDVVTVKDVKEEKPDLKAIQAAMSYMKMTKNRTFLLLKSGEVWREEKVYPSSKLGPEDKLVKEAMSVAERILNEDIAIYSKQRENAKRSESRWLKTVLVSGTMSDKIAALTLLIQESPVHNVSSIDTLLSMASKKCRRETLLAVDTLKDLFLTGLLPNDRKLKSFHQFPLYDLWEMTSGNVDQRDKLLLGWYFEDLLKKKYSQFIKILGEMTFDTVQATKEKGTKLIHDLLSSKPEQEHVLLPMLVNKMGDHNMKNKASFLLIKLVEEHPNMKGVIVREICQLLYRPNVSPRAQYYAICFLTQVRLSMDESSLAMELIKIYLSFFQTNLKKRLLDTKTMSALLTGMNRAYVYASASISELTTHMDEVYRIIPKVNFQIGVQALMLLFHITDSSSEAATRFYSALYRKLHDPALATTTKHSVFLNLIFKSIKRDTMHDRVMAFIKRVLQVYAHHPANIVCGVLILLSQIISVKPDLLKRKHTAEVSWNDREEEVKDEDEEEKFVDLPIPDEFADKSHPSEKVKRKESGEATDATCTEEDVSAMSSVKTSWVHRTNTSVRKTGTSYDPHYRNPLYSKAELECTWELNKLSNHFHPTVSLYASQLLNGESIDYTGDPLLDYTLIRFLDRFVYKNPKKASNQTGVGVPQQKKTNVEKVAVNSKEFLKQTNVSEDDAFYVRYFAEKERQKKDREDDEDSVGDDEFDQYLEKYVDGKKEDFGDFDMDFARETKSSKKGSKKKNAEIESDEDDEEDDDEWEDMDLDDDEMAAEFERELQGLGAGDNDDDEMASMRLGKQKRRNRDDDEEEDFDEEDVNFSSDEDDGLGSMMMKPKGKRKRNDMLPTESLGVEKKKKRKLNQDSLFASAEEFSHLLEEGIDSGAVSLGSVNQMRNQDKASVKQLVWEEKRDKWLNDGDKAYRGGKKGKSFGKARKSNHSNFKNKPKFKKNK